MLTEVSFYRLTTLPLLRAAPKLIEKIYYSKQNLVVIAEKAEMLAPLDQGLWSYSTKHFIAHGTLNDPHPEEQPVYLTHKIENPNKADLIMLLGRVELDNNFASKYLYMFDGNDKEQLEFARKKWKAYKEQGINATYWQQSEAGSWEKQ